MGIEGAKTISESLKINTSLTTLDLGSDERIRKEKVEMKWNDKWKGNEIGDEGTQAISESLKINTSLTSLNLWGDEKNWKWKEVEENNENE